MSEAYVLLLINVKRGAVEGAGIYSEETPTTMPGYVYAQLFRVQAATFHDAHRDARATYVRCYHDVAARYPIRGGS